MSSKTTRVPSCRVRLDMNRPPLTENVPLVANTVARATVSAAFPFVAVTPATTIHLPSPLPRDFEPPQLRQNVLRISPGTTPLRGRSPFQSESAANTDNESDETASEGAAEAVGSRNSSRRNSNSSSAVSINSVEPITASTVSPYSSARRGKLKHSCHQCKCSKPDDVLVHCTNVGVRRRRCRKKFCYRCLLRTYQIVGSTSLQNSDDHGYVRRCELRCPCANCVADDRSGRRRREHKRNSIQYARSAAISPLLRQS